MEGEDCMRARKVGCWANVSMVAPEEPNLATGITLGWCPEFIQRGMNEAKPVLGLSEVRS